MHNNFYASGFLYHPITQQILLQQETTPSPTSSPWNLFGDLHTEKEEPEVVLKKVIITLLNIKITVVHHIYTYANEEKETSQFIGYAISQTKPKFSPKKGLSFGWFSFKDVLKLQISEQTKHDIVVGQRVIEAAERKRLGLHTFQ